MKPWVVEVWVPGQWRLVNTLDEPLEFVREAVIAIADRHGVAQARREVPAGVPSLIRAYRGRGSYVLTKLDV